MENCCKDKRARANHSEEELVRQKRECDHVCSDQQCDGNCERCGA